MPGVKTAISLDENLFEKVNEIANELHISRSKVFTLAMLDFLKKQENKKLFAQINKAYEDQPTEEESKIMKSMRKSQIKISEKERW
jgi:metal-responsive CopG/Arc/MetJ family transcriptional regulator